MPITPKFEFIDLREAERAFNKSLGRAFGINNLTWNALYKAAQVLFNDMDTTPPRIPVDTGRLRNSWFVEDAVPKNSKKEAAVYAGFDALYARIVHENIGAVNWKRPGSGAKFFSAALARNANNNSKMYRAISESLRKSMERGR